MKRIFRITLSVLLVIFLFSCTPTKYKLSVDTTSLVIRVGEKKEIKPVHTKGSTISMTVSDESMLRIEKGVVEALKEGNCVITVTLNEDKQQTFDIDVTVIEPKKVFVNRLIISGQTIMTEGETQNLTLRVEPYDASNKNVEWISSDETIVSVENGKLTALKVGSANITVKALDGSNVEETFSVTVNAKVVKVTDITIDGNNIMTEGDVQDLTVSVLPNDATNKEVSYLSSDPTVVSVENGRLTALKAGSATITVKALDGSNVEETFSVTVNAKVIKVTDITIDGNNTMIEGDVQDLTVSVLPNDATNKEVSYLSSDPTVVSVVNGKLTALKAGSATITVKALDGSNVEETFSVTVNAKVVKVTDITIDGNNTMTEGDVQDLTVSVLPNDATNKEVSYLSSDSTVVSVENGKLTALKAGSATITVKALDGSNVEKTFSVTVNAKQELLLECTVGTGGDFSTLAEATSACSDNAVITILPGTYNENVTINKHNLTILGPNSTIVGHSSDRTLEAEFNGTITLNSGIKGITIKGMKFIGSSKIMVPAGTAAVSYEERIYTTEDFTFENNYVSITAVNGKGFIQLDEANNNYSKNVKLIGNYINGNNVSLDGLVYMYNNENFLVDNNVFENISGDAFATYDTTKGYGTIGDIIVTNNIFKNVTGSAIWVNYYKPVVNGEKVINISYNKLTNVKGGAALDLENAPSNSIYKSILVTHNEFVDVYKGIWMDEGTDTLGTVGVFNYNLFQFVGESAYVYRVSSNNKGKGDCRYNLYLDIDGNVVPDSSLADNLFTGGVNFKDNNFGSKEAYYEDLIDYATYYVGEGCEYTTLQDAIDAAEEKTIIVLKAGTYSSNVELNKNNIIIIGPNQMNSGHKERASEAEITGVITLVSGLKGITFKGLKFTGSALITILPGTTSIDTFSMRVNTTTDFTFENNYVDSSLTGEYGFIEFNELNNNYSKNVTIKNNYFTGTASVTGFVYMDNSENLYVQGNVFENISTNAIYVKDTTKGWGAIGDVVLVNNKFLNVTKSALWVNYYQPAENGVSNIIITHNTLVNVQGGAAIDFEKAGSNGVYASVQILYNSFENVYKGVWLSTAYAQNGLSAIINYNYFKFGSSVGYPLRISSANPKKADAKYNLYLRPDGTLFADSDLPDNYFTGCIDFKGHNFNSVEEYMNEFKPYSEDETTQTVYSKVTYEGNGGSVSGGAIYQEGKEFELPVPVKPGFNFLGWSLEQEGTAYLTALPKTQTGDVTVYAQWEEIYVPGVMVTYEFEGGLSSELYLASATPSATIPVHNYNYELGTYWGNSTYGPHIHIGTLDCDPKATFSDRAYIGLNPISNLYEVVGVQTSGASETPAGAEYVITMSSSFESYRDYHSLFQLMEVGQVVVFEKSLDQASKEFPCNVLFYKTAPTATSLTKKATAVDTLIVPSKLGFEFQGWYDSNGKLYSQITDLTEDVTLIARWNELTPVTDISVETLQTELITGSTSQIVASIVPTDAFFQQVFYSSSNKDIVSVSALGLMTAVNAGSATITLTDYVGHVVKNFEVVVYMVDSIDAHFDTSFDGVLEIGESVQLNAVSIGKNAVNVLSYMTSDNGVLVVDENGLITATGNGEAIITVYETNNPEKKLDIRLTVASFNDEERVDELLKLLAESNFATAEYGNICLYNDGTDRNYQPNYGSLNKYLFLPLIINDTYSATAEANPNCHKNRRSCDTIEFVTVHDTATLTGTAATIASNMASGETSIHYVTGNGAVYTVVPEQYIAYHAGDGTALEFAWTQTNINAPTDGDLTPEFGIVHMSGDAYLTINGVTSNIKLPKLGNGNLATEANLTHLGPTWKVVDGVYYIGGPLTYSSYGVIGSFGGNCNSIGIEMCVNLSGDCYHTWQLTAVLVADILIRNNLDPSRVKQHNTWIGKNCPQSMIAGSYWDNFMEMVELCYEIRKNFSDAEITFECDSELIGTDGHIVKAPLVTTVVDYTVKVKIGETEKSIKLSSIISGSTTWEQWTGTYSSATIWNNGKFVSIPE